MAINLIGERIAIQPCTTTTTAAAPPQHTPDSPASSPHDTHSVDPPTAARLAEISTAKATAIAAEDYDEAKRLKRAADVLRALGRQIYELEAKKAAAVVAEEYDACKALKAQVDQIRNSAEYRAAFALNVGALNVEVGAGVGRAREASVVAALPMATPPPAPLRGHPIESPLSPGMEWCFFLCVCVCGGVYGGTWLQHPTTTPHHPPPPLPTADAYDERPIKGRGTYILDDADLEQLNPNTAAPPTNKASPHASPSSPVPTSAHHTQSPRTTNSNPPPTHAAASSTNQNHTADVPAGFPTDLPLPEAVLIQHSKDAEPLLPHLGEYITRACFSRIWQLREAALVYITTHVVGTPSTTTATTATSATQYAYKPLVRLATLVLRDKVANVVIAGVHLLRVLVQRAATESSTTARDISNSLAEWLPAVVEKACDSNTRIKDAATGLILYTAAVPEAHMSAHANVLLRPSKHPGVWKIVLGRLQLLGALLPVLGLADGGAASTPQGLHVEPLMRFIATTGLSSANADVRGEATRLAVDIAGVVGPSVLRMLPGDVHSMIREQIAAAASCGGGEGGDGGAMTPVSATTASARRPGSMTGSARRTSARGGGGHGSGRRAVPPRDTIPPAGGNTSQQHQHVAQAVATVTAVAMGGGGVLILLLGGGGVHACMVVCVTDIHTTSSFSYQHTHHTQQQGSRLLLCQVRIMQCTCMRQRLLHGKRHWDLNTQIWWTVLPIWHCCAHRCGCGWLWWWLMVVVLAVAGVY